MQRTRRRYSRLPDRTTSTAEDSDKVMAGWYIPVMNEQRIL